ncbi:MAG: lanthionine synthetase LanC family protein, partial [Gaiellaceae bacterium]
MSELWREAEHEPLEEQEWDERRARVAIAAIVADAELAFDGARWPWHPRDGDDDEDRSDLYLGGAGMVWALHELGSTGWNDAALAFVDRYRAAPPADEQSIETSYHFGELGIALAAYRLTGDSGLADRVHELVLADPASDLNEVMSGSPGSLLAAEAMLAWTGEPRWEEAWHAAEARVLAARDPDGLWTQSFPGRTLRFLGPAHGYAGNIRALANRGGDVELADLSAYLLREDGLANWMPTTEITPEQIRVQWCHGAPGIVSTLGHLIDEELAVAGGELAWRPGPLRKGANLCHGTAGNG